MNNKSRLPLRKICLVLLLPVVIILSCAHGAVSALTASDLIIVFNRNLPESREVAAYYAGKRRVPADNLVGVEVPTSEDLSRKDYDEKLAPPVKAMVDRLKPRAGPRPSCWFTASPSGWGQLLLPCPTWSSSPWQPPGSRNTRPRRCR